MDLLRIRYNCYFWTCLLAFTLFSFVNCYAGIAVQLESATGLVESIDSDGVITLDDGKKFYPLPARQEKLDGITKGMLIRIIYYRQEDKFFYQKIEQKKPGEADTPLPRIPEHPSQPL